jgi:hypothetical protein
MKKRTLLFLSAILFLVVAIEGVHSVYAVNQTAPQPDVVPAEIGVSPYSQTVLSPSYEGVWDVSVFGEGSSYCINACWGDPCGCAKSCGYAPGDSYSYHHRFVCGGSSPFTQSWTLSGIGGPAFDSSIVYK